MAPTRPVEMPAEWGGKVPTHVFIDEALTILRAASEAKVSLKMLGGLAIKVHSLNEEEFANRLGRSAEPGQEYSDIDFATYYKSRDGVRKVMESFGYSKRPSTMSTSASQRQIYFHPKGWFYIDVFWDKLKAANHPISFRGRLEIDPISIPLSDLLLEKLQIVSFSRKDLLDTLLILKAHALSEKEEPETISTDRLARVLSRDWGFWHTVTTNLHRIREYLKDMTILSQQESTELVEKLDRILLATGRASKSLKWRLRALVGTRKKWYNPVETDETVGGFGIWQLREPSR
ncbi:MAG: hypothetical protein AUF79_10465 [Crenarchaeota archaeon 13_1_20CM_2_51_8]|nr:MAG: hypothetical protein AUF79_10465 [Crenarchaeota archaeon 13_1_20CM_2_51_8]